MNITLNIGLEVSNNYLPSGVASMEMQYKHVKNCLEKCFGIPSCIGIARSNTEKTVVAQYTEVKEVLSKLHSLAHDLGQDCIAYQVQSEDGNVLGGALVGKYAHEWNYGIFDEVFFVPATIKLNYRIGLPL